MEIDILTGIAAFLAKPSTQAVTLGVCLVAIFVAMPLMQRKVSDQLPPSQRAHFDRLARDVRMQLWGQYAGLSLCTLAFLNTRSTGFVSGDIFPSICLGTGVTALWNLRKSVVAITNAQPHSNRNRNERLAGVYAAKPQGVQQGTDPAYLQRLRDLTDDYRFQRDSAMALVSWLSLDRPGARCFGIVNYD